MSAAKARPMPNTPSLVGFVWTTAVAPVTAKYGKDGNM